MITHYGLFWSERDVFWGRQKNPGRLLGRIKTPLDRPGAPSKEEIAKATDFRDYIGLYCLYGDGELLYVGQAGIGSTNTLFSRLKDHLKGPLSGRWDRFSWFGRESCSGKTELKAALSQLEAVSIAIVNPGFNRQSGSFNGATQVFQVPHEDAKGDLETQLARLNEKFESLIKQVPE